MHSRVLPHMWDAWYSFGMAMPLAKARKVLKELQKIACEKGRHLQYSEIVKKLNIFFRPHIQIQFFFNTRTGWVCKKKKSHLLMSRYQLRFELINNYFRI